MADNINEPRYTYCTEAWRWLKFMCCYVRLEIFLHCSLRSEVRRSKKSIWNEFFIKERSCTDSGIASFRRFVKGVQNIARLSSANQRSIIGFVPFNGSRTRSLVDRYHLNHYACLFKRATLKKHRWSVRKRSYAQRHIRADLIRIVAFSFMKVARSKVSIIEWPFQHFIPYLFFRSLFWKLQPSWTARKVPKPHWTALLLARWKIGFWRRFKDCSLINN